MGAIDRDPHAGPVPDEAWALDAETRATGRVQIFNAMPGGLDGWTMDLAQYSAVRALILEMLGDAPEGVVYLKELVAAAQDRYGTDPLFPKGRLTNHVRYTKTDMEARCEVERIPGSSPQRVSLWRDGP